MNCPVPAGIVNGSKQHQVPAPSVAEIPHNAVSGNVAFSQQSQKTQIWFIHPLIGELIALCLQAPSMTANNIKYLHSEQPQNRPVIRRQLPSLTALPENIFRPGTTSGSNPHMSGLAQGAFGGSRR